MYTRLGQRQPKHAGPTHGQQHTPEHCVMFVEGARDVISNTRSTTPRYPNQWQLPVFHNSKLHYDMLGMIAAYPMLRRAADCVRWRGELPGTDGRTYYREIQSAGINEYLRDIGHAIKEDRYEFSPLRRIHIPKDDGSRRTLDIPTIQDRVVECATAIVLYEWCSPTWSQSSMGFRKGVSHQDVMMTLQDQTVEAGRHIWLSTDIADAFGSIPHQALLEIIAREIPHDGIQSLVKNWLRSDSWKNQHGQQDRGLPQGSPLSPFMLNLYMNHVLDQKLDKAGTPFIRYADDLLIPCHDESEAAQRLEEIKNTLRPWGLRLKEAKTIIKDARREQIPYIGFLTSIKDLKISLDIDAGKHIQHLREELFIRASINSDCREYAVKLEDQTSQAKMVIEGWLQHFSPGITNGRLDQILKGIKGTLIELNIGGVQSTWIKDVWKRSRARWEARWDHQSQDGVEPSGMERGQDRGQQDGSEEQGSGRSQAIATGQWDTPLEDRVHPSVQAQGQGRPEGIQTQGTPQARATVIEDGNQNWIAAPFTPTGWIDNQTVPKVLQTQERLESSSSADQSSSSPLPVIQSWDTRFASQVKGQDGSSSMGLTESSSQGDTTVQDDQLKYDASRGITKQSVQQAALWLFDGSELLPAPVAVLDPSAPRRPGPMDQDWALTIV